DDPQAGGGAGGATGRANRQGKRHPSGQRVTVAQAPRSAADPRPGDRPYFIAGDCPEHGVALVLSDQLREPGLPAGERWFDEWECPSRFREKGPEGSGAFMDWPEGERRELLK